MRINQSRIYPYPVFSELTNDYKCKGLVVDTELEYDSEKAYIKLKPEIEDKKICDMIENDECGLFCHVECSSTKYRELFELDYSANQPEYNIEIPLYKVNDAVEIMCAIVAKEDIDSFSDDNLNPLFDGMQISFPRYATIGYTATTEIVITKRIDVNGDVPSIFSINRSDTDTNISYDYTGDQIVVYLPAEQYKVYFDYVGQGVRVKQMMLNLPVLVDVINVVKEDNAGLENRAWYAVLESAFQRNGYTGLDDPQFKAADTIMLAQIILGDICKDAFNEFDIMNQDRSN